MSVECFLHTPFPVLALVVHPDTVQVPSAPCLVQTRDPTLRGVSHPAVVQNPFFPPCLVQKPPFLVALALQLPTRHLPFAPCLSHKPCDCALVVQPSIEHGFLPWVPQSPLACTLLGQPSTGHTLPKKDEEKRKSGGGLNDTLHPTGLIERVLFNLNAARQIRSYPKRQRWLFGSTVYPCAKGNSKQLAKTYRLKRTAPTKAIAIHSSL